MSGRCPRKYAPEVSRKCLGRVSAIAPTESTPTTRQCDRSAATWQADSSREEEGGGACGHTPPCRLRHPPGGKTGTVQRLQSTARARGAASTVITAE